MGSGSCVGEPHVRRVRHLKQLKWKALRVYLHCLLLFDYRRKKTHYGSDMWRMSNLREAHARAWRHGHKHPSPYWWWGCLLTGGACSRKYKLTQHKQAPAGLALQHGAIGALT